MRIKIPVIGKIDELSFQYVMNINILVTYNLDMHFDLIWFVPIHCSTLAVSYHSIQPIYYKSKKVKKKLLIWSKPTVDMITALFAIGYNFLYIFF